ncbi:MAG: hypothetical protein M3321_01405 [Actinomycetota bacterium]|nr:hypothetical protein [Actinomycetota bacterium]
MRSAACALAAATLLAAVEGAEGSRTGQGSSARSTASGRIAFTRYPRAGDPVVLAISVDGRKTVRLLPERGQNAEPSWSRDGRRLAFTRVDRGFQGISVAHIASRRIVAITRHRFDPTDLVLDARPRWSPDGRRIVFHRFRESGARLYVVGVDGSGLRQLGPGWEPSWSPDGRWIAFADRPTREDGFDLFLVRPDGTGKRRLTSWPGNERHPEWSPDGRRLVLESDRSGNVDVYVARANGRGARRLTTSSAHDVAGAWSPDGRRIAFASRRVLGQFDIFVMAADGSRETRLTTAPADDAQPSWEPARATR